jgi:hypothetical protein
MAAKSLPQRGPRIRHGHAKARSISRTYRIWQNMLTRCSNPNSEAHARYGRLGVCDRWRSFDNFLADMGSAPPRLSLDRIDNSRGYSPDNCRWADEKTQQRNRSDNVMIEFQGRTQCVSAWAEELGIGQGAIHYRLRSGWSPERALGTPVRRFGAESCVHGHPFTPENTYFPKKGGRICRRCHADRQRARAAKH